MRKNNLNKVLITVQTFLTLLFCGYIFTMNILPTNYFIVVCILLILLLLICLVLMLKSEKKKSKGILYKIISLLISIAMVIAMFVVVRGNNTLNSITSSETQTHQYSLLVLNDSDFESIKDFTKDVVIYNNTYADDNFLKSKEKLSKSCRFVEWKTDNDYSSILDKLYNKEVSAILINDAYLSTLEDIDEDYIDKIRIIWTYEFDEKVNDFSKHLDVTQDTFTIYVSGIDTRGKVSTVSRSDVNMLVTVNPKTKEILLTSIPRDYYVELANYGKEDKLTHAGLGGIENSVKTIENFMGIEINYYARVNFTSLIKMVDALGGITVNSPVSFTTKIGKYKIVAGENYLDGSKALAFVRERKSLAGGDNDRVKNQQRVIMAMINKMISPAIITNYSGILDAIAGSFETNMKSSDITSLIKMQLNDMTSWNFDSIQLEGKGVKQYGGAMMPNHYLYYMIPDETSVIECSNRINQMVEGIGK